MPRLLSVLLVLTYPGSPTHGHASRMTRAIRRRRPLGFVAAQVGAIVQAQLRRIVGRA
ncbi:hypothetical protein CZ771_08550 [Actinomycetales bacterium JB111]|nr:hypothetical protein CZ771_08550 [Actinomycetales bacterium JB111]